MQDLKQLINLLIYMLTVNMIFIIMKTDMGMDLVMVMDMTVTMVTIIMMHHNSPLQNGLMCQKLS